MWYLYENFWLGIILTILLALTILIFLLLLGEECGVRGMIFLKCLDVLVYFCQDFFY